MAPKKKTRRGKAPVIDPADRLSDLPESILEQILSFLPDQEAVRTSVLARTWSHVWKFTPNLLIKGESVQEVRAFVDRLLRARLAGLVDGAVGGPLQVCKIDFSQYEDEDVPIVNLWIRFSLACRVQTLDIYMRKMSNDFKMSKSTLVSPQLTILKLKGVWFHCSYLDFSGCPALESLEIHDSDMTCVRKMTSTSVKHLVMTYIVCSHNYRFSICVPHLLSLRLENIINSNPVLESMPDLEEANVTIGKSSVADESDHRGGQNTTKCVLLDGLSHAQHLVLKEYKETNLFRRDLKWCPTFSKLKTLKLDGHWCDEPIDCCALVCILEHAPVLEELTFIFSEQGWSKYNVEIMGYLDAAAESNMMLPCLKIVKVKCRRVDEEVLSVLKYLGTLKIKFQIRV